jgi:adenylylsulfate kinase
VLESSNGGVEGVFGMPIRILVMGLPGAGKTFLAQHIVDHFQKAGKTVSWLNADVVRKEYNDWDFSTEGRLRQSKRMRTLAELHTTDYVICDFVAPLWAMRNYFDADWTIWVDTLDNSRFVDTDAIFEPPEHYDFRITTKDAKYWSELVAVSIMNNYRRPTFQWQKETVQMLGRWQPWHAGHRALFERAIKKTGQVMIQIRDCQGWNGTNPFAVKQVMEMIRKDLDPVYQGQYEIQVVPNITNITYGRDVGYTITEETFDEEITNISGTKIRQELGYNV